MIATNKWIFFVSSLLLHTTFLHAEETSEPQLQVGVSSSRKAKHRRSFKKSAFSKNRKKPDLKRDSLSQEQANQAFEKAFFQDKKAFFLSTYLRGTTTFQGFSLSPAVFQPIGVGEHHILGNDEGSVVSLTLGYNKSISKNGWVGAEFGLSYTVSGYYGAPVFFNVKSADQPSGISLVKAFVSFGHKSLGFSAWMGLRELYNQDVPTMSIRLRSVRGAGTGVQDISLSKNNSAKLDISFLSAANTLAGKLFEDKQTLFLLDHHFKNISLSNSAAKLGVQLTPMILMNVAWTSEEHQNVETDLPNELANRVGMQFALSYEENAFWSYKNGESSGNFLLQVGYGPGMKFTAPYPYTYVQNATVTPPIDDNPEGGMQSLNTTPIHVRAFYYGMFDIRDDIKMYMVLGGAFINGRKDYPNFWSTTSIRPLFYLGEVFHVQTEASLDVVTYIDNGTQEPRLPLFLGKLTIAPGVKFPGNLPGNPTISMFASMGFWNKNYQNKMGTQKRPSFEVMMFPKDQNYAFSWGFQIEASL